MKLDYNLLKDILIYLEENCDGHTYETLYREGIEKTFAPHTEAETSYHIEILCDDGLIENGNYSISGFTYSRLTAQGHRVLEVMKNDTLWGKIKKHCSEAGIHGLSEIPTLAIGIAMSSAF